MAISISIPQNGGEKRLRYSIDCDASVTFEKSNTSVSWYSVSSNTTNKIVTISAQTNNLDTSRNATINTKVNGETCGEKNINITQLGGSGYLSFTPTNDGTTFGLIDHQGSTVYYSLDNGTTWNTLDTDSEEEVYVELGQTILWKAESNDEVFGTFTSNDEFSVKGNVMSLIYGDNYEGQTSLNGCSFEYLFCNSSVVDASDLILPATTLANNCYQNMFYGCISLTTAPSTLPATTLANNCYDSMFQDCTNLTTAPSLPATTLANNCYQYMFQNCTNLTTAPELPATTLANNCYQYMFQDCTNLTTAPSLPATTLANNCYQNMFQDCTNLTTAPSLPATTLADFCYQHMFYGCTSLTIPPNSIGSSATTVAPTACCFCMFEGCTSLTTAPKLPITALSDSSYSRMFYGCTSLRSTAPSLPATTLADSCYYSMFQGCTNLTTAPSLQATTLANSCYRGMFQGCSSLTTAPLLPVTTLANSCYESMFASCSSLTTAPELLATTLAESCYRGMFQDCTSLTTAPSLPTTTLATYCYANMFNGCTSLTTAPELPATTLATSCYHQMFYGCTNLNYIKAMFIAAPSTSYMSNWVSGVASSGTFVKNPSSEWRTTTVACGNSTYPCNWIVEGDECYCTNIAKNYLRFDVINKITVTVNESTEYSLDCGNTWETLSPDTELDVEPCKSICWRRNSTSTPATRFHVSDGFYNVAGNIMSIIYGSNFENQTTIPYDNMFHGFFENDTHIVNAEDLVLPATSLTNDCYHALFSDCTSLTTAPRILPATTLTQQCYRYMFADCINLTTAPILCATTLDNACCEFMFGNCTSLTTVPQNMLPATTLAVNCYLDMFNGCSGLTTAPSLPATTLAVNCYEDMFLNCSSLTTAPELPATTLPTYCYNDMFNGCSSLSYIKCLATDISAMGCTSGWVQGVASSGTFVKASSMTDWTTSVDGIPNGWTIQNA